MDSGLCIGCGLCESVTDGRVTMEMSPGGSLRPSSTDFSRAEEATLLSACPGVVARGRGSGSLPVDEIWGEFSTMAYAWAGDPAVRFEAATGGVLTALGMFLVDSGAVTSVLHVGADPAAPMRSRSIVSRSAAEVRAGSGSRYGPTSPLSGLHAALDAGEPFALIAKPCDLGAVHALARHDARIDALCRVRMTLLCGGQSRLTKSTAVLEEFGLREDDVARFSYRGNGNPGPTRVETHDGRAFERSYNDMWDDEAGWDLEPRCTVCPDALGETADIVSGDVWPGGGPSGEDEGFNGLVVRTEVGERLVADAVAAEALVVGDRIDPRQYDQFQPHQVRKKIALAVRFEGLASADQPVIATEGLRVPLLGQRLGADERAVQIAGVRRRVSEGRYSG